MGIRKPAGWSRFLGVATMRRTSKPPAPATPNAGVSDPACPIVLKASLPVQPRPPLELPGRAVLGRFRSSGIGLGVPSLRAIDMGKLFISHSSKDDTFVRGLRETLAEHGQEAVGRLRRGRQS